MTEKNVRQAMAALGADDALIDETIQRVRSLSSVAIGTATVFVVTYPDGPIIKVVWCSDNGSGVTPLHPSSVKIQWLGVTTASQAL